MSLNISFTFHSKIHMFEVTIVATAIATTTIVGNIYGCTGHKARLEATLFQVAEGHV